ncbi:ROK family transcriptional regulator [Pseudomaricurvus alcaniphilus]|uniref:ROK family transcriptional regulator n=1 Tax=Pseudomaricurvus alcaniphilus TaxID=1166482 RepID=UPI001A9CFE80|nr:ROK family transcriptional regulator [Pseudomaricurvus alcaniphilus]
MSKKRPTEAPGNGPTPKETSSGRSQSGLRAFNERQILSLIRRQGALAKAEIATQTGLSAQAITVIINQLESEKLLLKGKPQRGRVGQPSVPYSLNPEGAFAYGLKVGRRSFDLTLEDFTGKVRGALHAPCDYPTVDEMLSFLRRGVEFLKGSIDEECAERIRGIGVATPFELWKWAQEMGAPEATLEQWNDFDFEKEMSALTDYPVYVCNDDTAACVAELIFGNPGNYDDFLYIFIGSFIGGGVVMNHTPILGSRANAGALGSLPVPVRQPDGTTAIQQLIKGASITTLEKMLIAAGKDASILWNSIEHWGDLGPPLEKWLEQLGEQLAYAAVCGVALIDAQAVIIDGSLPGAVREQIVARIREKVNKADLRGLSPFEVIEGTIGSRAQSIGSASLPLLVNFFSTDNRLEFKNRI